MISSTFSSFTTASLAMKASQTALDVIGQNIANANTEGYTRQRVDQVSINMRHTNGTVEAGVGVRMTGISQIRDPYLDVQYRNEIAKVGTSDAKQSTLDLLANIFDDTDAEGIRYALSMFEKSLRGISESPDQASDTIARARCQSLLNLFSSRSKELSDVRNQLGSELTDNHVPEINNLLKEISELNTSIWNSQVLGSPALELQDQRNDKLDTLASYLPIQVTMKERPISYDTTLTYPEVNFIGSDGNKYNLIGGNNGEAYAQLSASITGDGKAKVTLASSADATKTTDITNILKEGTLEGCIQMLNQSADLDDPPTDTRGLGYYEKTFDAFVNKFATTFNDLNKDSEGNEIPLFVTSDGTTSFTASNIQINPKWMNNEIGITISNKKLEDGTTDTSNIMDMLNALNGEQVFTAGPNDTVFFKGNFDQAYNNIELMQGIDSSTNSATLKNHISVAQKTMDSKDSVSGVSLDEEGINIMQFQRSYSAAARLMNALDEMLDTLINRTIS